MRTIAAGVAFLLGMAVGGGAVAAPQVLGLTATNAPIPLACDGDSCAALAGTFCLQRERLIPTWGTPYEASHPERLTLQLLGRDGRIAEVAGGPWVRFTAYDGYTMVRMSVPRSLLATHGATAVALQVGPGISLVPTPQTGDDDPQDAAEIAFATGPMRAAAARYLDRPSAAMDAARLVTALVTALPEKRTIRDDYGRLWQDTITDDMTDGLDPATLPFARDAYDRCHARPDFRRCLISRHREFMERDNAHYWDQSAGY